MLSAGRHGCLCPNLRNSLRGGGRDRRPACWRSQPGRRRRHRPASARSTSETRQEQAGHQPQAASDARRRGGRRQAAARQDQAAGGLQGRGLFQRPSRRAHHGDGRQGHDVHGHAASSAASMRSPTRTASARPRSCSQGLTQPNGLAFKDGALYVFAINKVFRYDNIEDKLDNPGTPVELTEAYGLPDTIHHNWKYVDFGPDGKMYVQVGANCNICEINPGMHGADPPLQRGRHRHGDRRARRSQHGRLRLASGDQGAVVHRQRPRLGGRCGTGGRAQSHRQRQGGRQLRLPLLPRQRHCRSRRQAAQSVRRRDVAGRVARPACRRARHQVLHRQHVPEELSERRLHRAARFLEPDAEVRLRRGGGAHLRRQGQDRAVPDRPARRQGNEFHGRPTYVLPLQDGSLLVSDEQNGAVYRITYGAPKTASR